MGSLEKMKEIIRRNYAVKAGQGEPTVAQAASLESKMKKEVVVAPVARNEAEVVVVPGEILLDEEEVAPNN